MTGALIVLAIGFAIIIADWHMATPVDRKTRQRKRLSPTDRMRLRQLFVATLVLAAAVYYFPLLFGD
jgi:hypothetical protein